MLAAVILLAAFSAALAQMRCMQCNQYCTCMRKLAPARTITTAKLDAAYMECEPDYPEYDGDMTSGAGPDDYDEKFDKYLQCSNPSCPTCQSLIDDLLGLNQAMKKRKKRSAHRQKRQATSTPTWLGGEADELEKCVAKKVGMSQEALLEYEERIGIADMGMIPCYLLSCGRSYKQMKTDDELCMKKYDIASEEIYGDYEAD